MNRKLALGMLALALVLSGCKKPKAGDPCKTEGKQLCTTKTDSLVCSSGKYEALPCRAAAGCTGTGDQVECANDGYLDGEPCDSTSDDHECSIDKKAQLKCEGKHWKTVDKCLGPAACKSTASEVHCDDTFAELGAPCTNADSYSCSVDKKTLLQCHGGKITLDSQCRGAAGCRKAGDKMHCDTTIAAVGDVCETDDEACSVDGKSMLKCKSLKMAVSETCKKGCTVTGEELHCN
ncbi:MAG TPA: hypothetical protein VF316_18730 [Polyangiaceae bacterium]